MVRSAPWSAAGGHGRTPLSSDERRGLLKRLLGRPASPRPTPGGSGKLFTAHSRPDELRPRPQRTADEPDEDRGDARPAPPLEPGGLFDAVERGHEDAPREVADVGDDTAGGGFDEELFSPENLAALEERARAEQAIAAERAAEALHPDPPTASDAPPARPHLWGRGRVTEPVPPGSAPTPSAHERVPLPPPEPGSDLRPDATYDVLATPPTAPEAIDAPPPPPAAEVVVSDIPPAQHPVEERDAGRGGTASDRGPSDMSALTDELNRLAGESALEADLDDDELSLDDLHELGSAFAEVERRSGGARPDVPTDDDEPAPWVGHTDQLDEPYAAASATLPHRPAAPAGEHYPELDAADEPTAVAEADDDLFVGRDTSPLETEAAATAEHRPTEVEDPADEPAAVAPEPGTLDAGTVVDDETSVDDTPVDDDPVHDVASDEEAHAPAAATPAPAAEAHPEPRPAVQRTAPTAAHAAAHDLPGDAPTTRVHADRIDQRPGPIKLTPSEAVTLAAEGPASLRRRRRDG